MALIRDRLTARERGERRRQRVDAAREESQRVRGQPPDRREGEQRGGPREQGEQAEPFRPPPPTPREIESECVDEPIGDVSRERDRDYGHHEKRRGPRRDRADRGSQHPADVSTDVAGNVGESAE